ncbi:Fe-Mn family superoxide dismutase [Metabacillus crassostreae]|nr:superoxide dismutase [Metabacillus crassostreae]MBM7602163.1 Fe-Mn family superoxide dismutase [Metabacillus crassostreae]
MSEEYILSMKTWCEEISNSFEEAAEELTRNVEPNELEKWQNKFIHFKEQLSENISYDKRELYEQANGLYLKLEEFFNHKNKINDDEVLRVHQQTVSVPIGAHTLPPLPYSYDALEPYIEREIMRLHHDKHHKSYVDGLNKAEKEMQKARKTNDFSLIKHWEREAAFNGAGHYLHTIFWNIMSPKGGGKPSGLLLEEINRTFESFESFKKHFSEAAKSVEAVGWTILVWAPRSRRLEILQAEKHQNLSQWDVIPLLVLDVWEHAYYLQYKNERGKYVDNWWNVVNWKEVENRFQQAKQITWQPY